MKAMTKKEFTKECFNEIKNLNNDELEIVRKGLYVLYGKLRTNGNSLDHKKLNSNSAFLLDITYMSAAELMKRFREEECTQD